MFKYKYVYKNILLCWLFCRRPAGAGTFFYCGVNTKLRVRTRAFSRYYGYFGRPPAGHERAERFFVFRLFFLLFLFFSFLIHYVCALTFLKWKWKFSCVNVWLLCNIFIISKCFCFLLILHLLFKFVLFPYVFFFFYESFNQTLIHAIH